MNREDLWIVFENNREHHVVFWAVIDRVNRVVLGNGISNEPDVAAAHAEELVEKLVGSTN